MKKLLFYIILTSIFLLEILTILTPIRYKSEAKVLLNKKDAYSLETYCEMLNSNEFRRITKSKYFYVMNIKGTTIFLLSEEGTTKYKSDFALKKDFDSIKSAFEEPFVWIDASPTRPIIPWWRSALALVLLAMFSVAARPLRR